MFYIVFFPVTAFTIERYVAICHPFLSHTMSKLSRAIKYIFLIWILSISCAVPQAIQTGIFEAENGNSWCTVLEERVLVDHLFELATVLFFFAPMALITVLYILIGMKLRSSTMIKRENGSTVQRNLTSNLTSNINQNTNQSTKRVLKMLGKRKMVLSHSKYPHLFLGFFLLCLLLGHLGKNKP